MPVSPWAVRYCIVISMLLLASSALSLSPGSGPEIHGGLPFFHKGVDLLVGLFCRVHNKRHADAPLRDGACRDELTVRRFIRCHDARPAIVRDRWLSLGVQREQEQLQRPPEHDFPTRSLD